MATPLRSCPGQRNAGLPDGAHRLPDGLPHQSSRRRCCCEIDGLMTLSLFKLRWMDWLKKMFVVLSLVYCLDDTACRPSSSCQKLRDDPSDLQIWSDLSLSAGDGGSNSCKYWWWYRSVVLVWYCRPSLHPSGCSWKLFIQVTHQQVFCSVDH